MFRQTSLLAYAEVKKTLNNTQSKVLEALEDIAPASDKDLAKHLNWPINSITPRRGELLTKGKIEEAFVAKDVTGRRVTFWKPINSFVREFGDV